MSETVSKEEWESWLNSPPTRVLRRALRARREQLKEQLSEGDFMEEQHFAHALKQAAVVSQCKLLKDIAELDLDLFQQEIDDEQIRTSPTRESGTS